MSGNIVLIGFMGTGKSSIARELEKQCGYRVIDTDQQIEKEQKMTINEIFARKGEAGFRKIETDLIRDELMHMDNAVISCGGGMPLREENRELLRRTGTVVWLQASTEELWNRLKGDTTRPLLACENPRQRIEELTKLREPLYRAAADMEILTDGKAPARIAQEIRNGVKCREENKDDKSV